MNQAFTQQAVTQQQQCPNLDVIFNTARTAVDAGQAIAREFCAPPNNGDRRNSMMMNGGNTNGMMNQMYQQPVTYAYAYGGNHQSNSGWQNQQQNQSNSGYPGFYDPTYGSMGQW